MEQGLIAIATGRHKVQITLVVAGRGDTIARPEFAVGSVESES